MNKSLCTRDSQVQHTCACTLPFMTVDPHVLVQTHTLRKLQAVDCHPFRFMYTPRAYYLGPLFSSCHTQYANAQPRQ